jgi:hypothetical protein
VQDPQLFANRPRELARATDKLVRGTERKCAWVNFPNGKAYMLPIIARHQKMVPVFDEEGGCSVKVIAHDPTLADMVDQFLLTIANTEGSQIEATANAYGSFMRLVKALIQANYDLTDAEVAEVLTASGAELSRMWSAILLHVLSA